MPKRQGYLLGDLCEWDNIVEGYNKSKHGKTYVHNMLKHKEFNPQSVLEKIQYDFLNGTYKTSDYTIKKIYEPKERIIFRLPYAPDRIAQHCIMNISEKFWTNKIPNTSFSCIKGRGVSGAYRYMKKCLKDKENTKYCLKCDIKKFFPSISHKILKRVISRYWKDDEVLSIMYEIIDSTDNYVKQTGIGKIGYNVPIGNYPSQYLANLIIALAFICLRKKYKSVKIIIYMDDICFLCGSKDVLHNIKKDYQHILEQFELSIKDDWQVFEVDKRGISFVGFVFYHDRILLRKNIVKSIYKLCWKYRYRQISKLQFKRSMASYYGWIKCADTKGLCERIYNITGIYYSNWKGVRTKISTLYDKDIRIYHIDKRNKYFVINAVFKNKSLEIVSTNKKLLKNLFSIKKNNKYPNVFLKYYI